MEYDFHESYAEVEQTTVSSNGTIRTAHPSELFGDDWLEWPGDSKVSAAAAALAQAVA